MMSRPIPMPRTMMQSLKADMDEKSRMSHLKNIVESLYQSAVACARKGQATSYNYPIPITNTRYSNPEIYSPTLGISFPAPYKKSSDPFYIENMSDILSSLQSLFPECTISHSIMAKGTDGKLYDISKLEDAVLPFVDRALDQSYIVIDWS